MKTRLSTRRNLLARLKKLEIRAAESPILKNYVIHRDNQNGSPTPGKEAGVQWVALTIFEANI